MSKMNNKGFLLAESLIVTTFVLTVLVFLFIQFKNIMINNRKNYVYNKVSDIYNLGSLNDCFVANKIGSDWGFDSRINVDAIDIRCQDIANEMGLKYVIYTNSDISQIKTEELDRDVKEFVDKVNYTKIEGQGRLIGKFNTKNIATIAIKKL